MITGIGVDLVEISRFERLLELTPRLRERLFTPAERALPVRSLATRFAAKEALTKALGDPVGMQWTEIEVITKGSEPPSFILSGSTAATVARRGITGIHLTMAHDGDVAVAYVVAESANRTLP
ncbi:holo-ACP synthase [Microbacterium trichothecenolyticum]|uniref:holo-ACP synthase n=1 Tax=Microbacterium trichothecenolyticum TaxID=69370 RepID=UPI0035BEA02B